MRIQKLFLLVPQLFCADFFYVIEWGYMCVHNSHAVGGYRGRKVYLKRSGWDGGSMQDIIRYMKYQHHQ